MTQEHSAAAIITAGGLGRRMGSSKPKQYLTLHGCPIIIHTLNAFLATKLFKQIILVAPEDHLAETRTLLREYQLESRCDLVGGGTTRQESVGKGLEQVDAQITYVVVHDGVRPLIDIQIIKNCLQAAYQSGAAIAAIPVKDTLKLASDSLSITKTVPRTQLWRAQTPQASAVSLLRSAYKKAAELDFSGTDEASLLELINCQVTLIEGSESNIKITLPEDILLAEALLSSQKNTANPVLRIGHGYDAHQLVPGRPLILGGVNIPHPTGLLGHSDADVLTHALCDGILGALGQGDLGRHFPDSDNQYKNAESLGLLETVMELCRSQNYQLNNADITVIAQQPKIAPHLQEMKKNLCRVCNVPQTAINIKATTTEKMGFTGREEGICCHAVVLLTE
jgi:2-C-methyl-D-erythritol 4-phosphate cytidylyltransferase/2-C-methyl-D-erythritol 2,4-cyclodiphosphate synthase